MATKAKGNGDEVTEAVMKDKVTKAAIKHSGSGASPSRAADEKAQRSEAALRSKGQRDTSELWEETQRALALVTVRSTVGVAGLAGLFGAWLGIIESVRVGAFVFLYGIANLVVGFYFGRTNHQRVGGIGGDSAGTR